MAGIFNFLTFEKIKKGERRIKKKSDKCFKNLRFGNLKI